MSTGIELLACPKKDPIDRCPFRRPAFIIPDTYLPGWYRLPLCRKVPAKTNPDDPVLFTRPRLGKNLYRTFVKKDFDVSPRKDLPLEYNCLHDPHLHRYFRVNPRNYMGLVRDGFISPFKDDVFCTQAEFNQYREYIRSIIVQAEKERRKTEEKRMIAEQSLRKQEKIRREKNKPLEWLKKQLLRKRKHRIRILEELEDGEHETHQEEEDDEDDEYLRKAEEKKEFLEVEDQIKRAIDEEEAIKELREASKYKRKEAREEKKRKKAVAKWHNMKKFERNNIDLLDELKRNHDENFYRRAERRQKKHNRMWAKYKGLDLNGESDQEFPENDERISENEDVLEDTSYQSDEESIY